MQSDRRTSAPFAGKRLRVFASLLVVLSALLVLIAGCGTTLWSGQAVLSYSTLPDHVDASPLNLQTLTGSVYIFVPEVPDLKQVAFYLDDAAMTAPPLSVQGGPPFAMIVGGSPTGVWDTTTMIDGPHTLTALLSLDGPTGTREERLSASFVVRNASAGAGPGPTTQRRLFGAWVAGGPWAGLGAYIEPVEQAIGYKFDIVHWYEALTDPWVPSMVNAISAGGQIPMITWEAHTESLADIAAGKYDSIFHTWATGIKAHQGLVYLRPFQEMNTDAFAWGMQPTQFVAAWRHMVDVFKADGATNVRWVWSPNADDNPATASNKLENYYPGAAYVDVLAIDGYNWGTCKSWSTWHSFDQVFHTAYARVAALGDQPIWIAEFGSAEPGGDKAQWIRDAFASTDFPRVRALVYFDENSAAGCDWRIDSSPSSLTAFIDSLKTFR